MRMSLFARMIGLISVSLCSISFVPVSRQRCHGFVSRLGPQRCMRMSLFARMISLISVTLCSISFVPVSRQRCECIALRLLFFLHFFCSWCAWVHNAKIAVFLLFFRSFLMVERCGTLSRRHNLLGFTPATFLRQRNVDCCLPFSVSEYL